MYVLILASVKRLLSCNATCARRVLPPPPSSPLLLSLSLPLSHCLYLIRVTGGAQWLAAHTSCISKFYVVFRPYEEVRKHKNTIHNVLFLLFNSNRLGLHIYIS